MIDCGKDWTGDLDGLHQSQSFFTIYNFQSHITWKQKYQINKIPGSVPGIFLIQQQCRLSRELEISFFLSDTFGFATSTQWSITVIYFLLSVLSSRKCKLLHSRPDIGESRYFGTRFQAWVLAWGVRWASKSLHPLKFILSLNNSELRVSSCLGWVSSNWGDSHEFWKAFH